MCKSLYFYGTSWHLITIIMCNAVSGTSQSTDGNSKKPTWRMKARTVFKTDLQTSKCFITVGKSWIQTEVRTEAPLLNSCLQMCWGTLIYWSIFLVNYGKFLNSSFLQLVDVFSSWGSFGLEYKLYSNPKGFNSGGLGLSLVWSMFNALMKKKVNRQIFLKIWCKLDTKCPENHQ